MNAQQRVVAVLYALAESIRECGEIPSGTLYAASMNVFQSVDQFNSAIARLVGAKLVERCGDVLKWIGPAIPR